MDILITAILILLIPILGFILGLLFMIVALEKYLLIQQIKNLPSSKVQSAAVGLIELYGKAKRKKRMLSPISGKKCVYWEINAQYKELVRNKWIGLYWKKEFSPFYLEDKTGRMLVDPKGARVEIPHDNRYQGYFKEDKVLWATFEKIDKSVIKFIKKLPKEDREKFMDHELNELKIVESYIAEDDLVYILGDAEINKKIKSNIGYKNLVMKKGGSKVMYISDTHEKYLLD
jgi:hypothetical protein